MFMKNYSEGDIVTGIVTGIEDYGIFLSFDNNKSGLVHISEISNSFVKNVNDYANINDSLTVKILSPLQHEKENVENTYMPDVISLPYRRRDIQMNAVRLEREAFYFKYRAVHVDSFLQFCTEHFKIVLITKKYLYIQELQKTDIV